MDYKWIMSNFIVEKFIDLCQKNSMNVLIEAQWGEFVADSWWSWYEAA